MIFHENRLLADDSHVISFLIFVENWKMSQNLSSAAVVIGPLRVEKEQKQCDRKTHHTDLTVMQNIS